jgi:plasmid maintenance system antidote protein VapI
MDNLKPNWIGMINGILSERRAKNPRYSLRAFSRDIAISPAVISRLLSGKRPLTPEVACRIGLNLELTDEQFKDLVKSSLEF